ncbi:MAG: ATP-binding cassette domain-containing protein [Chitinophagaceae bacterium]|nr:ATP-binding cassette domain-containing protein [Chitinophagaceae bacterium]
MTILLSDAGKRFNRDWIFRHLNYSFEKGKAYAITGPNGSGKSTFLQVLSGGMMLNEGLIEWKNENGKIDTEKIFQHISLCAPYLELVEEMTLNELLSFHQNFKPFIPGISVNDIVLKVGLDKAAKKQIRNYSSGMKQRVKLAQCIFSDTPIVLLDEPCTNLDAEGISLYQSLIDTYCKEKMVIVSSNDEMEYGFCENIINMSNHK